MSTLRYAAGTPVTVTLDDGTQRPGVVRTDHLTAGHGHTNYTVDWSREDGTATYGTFDASDVGDRGPVDAPALRALDRLDAAMHAAGVETLADQQSFRNYFLGSLSCDVPPEIWDGALEVAAACHLEVVRARG